MINWRVDMCTLLMYLHDVTTSSFISENHKVHGTMLLVGEGFCEILWVFYLSCHLPLLLQEWNTSEEQSVLFFSKWGWTFVPFRVFLHFVKMLNLQHSSTCDQSKPTQNENNVFLKFFPWGGKNGHKVPLFPHWFSLSAEFFWAVPFAGPCGLCLSSHDPDPENLTLFLPYKLAKSWNGVERGLIIPLSDRWKTFFFISVTD